MKKIFCILFVIILLCLTCKPVSAEGPSTYETTVTVTNVSEDGGEIFLNFVNPDGSHQSEILSSSIDALETKLFNTFPIASGFTGSMIISSNVPLASSSNIIGKTADGSTMNYASYVGVSSGASSVFLPLLMDSNYGFNTYYSVQNTGSTEANVTINYSDNLSVPTITNLKPGAAVIIDNNTESHSARKFSATLETEGEIAVTVVEWADGSYGTQLSAYNGFPENYGTTNPIIPMVNQNNYGFWTSIPIQNLGNVASVVTLTYIPTKAGTTCTEKLTIPAGGLAEFGAYAHVFSPQTSGTTCTLGEKFVGIAIVTGNSQNVPLIGLMNQSTTIRADYEKAGALMSINPDLATAKIVFPESYQWFGNDSWWSSITVTNVSGSTLTAGDITCRGIGSANGSSVDIQWSNPSSLSNGSGWITDLFNNWGPLPNGFMGSVICESASVGKIVGTLNNLGHTASDTLDSYTLSEGLNVTP